MYRAVNGHTNSLWGWGYEDNDLYYRLVHGAKVEVSEQGKRASRYGRHNFGFTRPNSGWVNGHQINKSIIKKMWGDNLLPHMKVDGLNSCCYKIDSDEFSSEYNCRFINVYL